MLRITIEFEDLFDEEKNKFIIREPITVDLEHSLISLSKWESKHQKPFLSGGWTTDEMMDYIKTMVLTPGVNLDLLIYCSQENFNAIQEYINSKESATTFGMMPERRGPSEVITSELIYYWLVAFNIPWEAQYWHLNRLFSLIRICNIKNSNQKGSNQRVNTREAAEERARINEEQRKRFNTSG